MELEYSIYELNPLKKLNRFSSGECRRGVLFRLNQKYYMDYHPWEQFGDIGVYEMIKTIQEAKTIPDQFKKLFELDKKRNEIPKYEFKNHFFGSDSNEVGVYKIKFTDSLSDLKTSLEKITQGAKARIDFNNALNLESFLDFWNELDAETKTKVDYFEDPLPYSEKAWRKILDAGIPLACDRNPKDHSNYLFEIYKPNVDSFVKRKVNKIFSSYMGHDLGRFHCYLSLMESGDLELVHGIDTPNIYEEQFPLFYRSNGVNQLSLDLDSVNLMYSNLESLKWKKLI